MGGELRPERLRRFCELSLFEVDDAERAARLGNIRLQLQRTLQRRDSRLVVSLFGVRLSDDDVQLGAVAIRGEQLREDRFGFRGPSASYERHAVGELQRRIRV